MQKFSYWIGPFIATMVPLSLFIYLKLEPSIDLIISVPKEHFIIVSMVALLSTVISLAVGVSGTKLRNIHVTFLSLAFISLTEIFALHGLATPGFIIDASSLPGVAAQLSILFAVFWLWLSSLSSDHPVVLYISSFQKWLVPVWTIILGVCCVLAMLFPQLANVIPVNQNPLNWLITAMIITLSLHAIIRYMYSYRFSRLPLQLTIVYSTCWLMVSQVIMILGEMWRISWWLYHFLLLFSVIMMLIGLVRQYASKSSVTMAVKSLFHSNPVERIEACISPSIKALVVATEASDEYTAGHNFRVALFALQIAEEMGVTPDQLRALAQGGVVHDVGKLQVPDHILNKPGQLTEEERAMIELHPVTGYEMCKRLGFMKEELDIIRYHHERWDGSGYPDRLKGKEIPFLARILAVADVYDALTSNRSYRKAWTNEAAMKVILEEKGSHFDADCVDAWVRVCQRNPDTYQHLVKNFNEEESHSVS
ncbi:HD-GYP domain-containing protein [Aquibacillus albus]|uniref:Nucleotidyltransferase with HDIG domain n=1 Tax=Aquibacillus albus TaxID=1168171 RepID=A0ABS2N5E0_9BACI|nr:HD domain-containing phosphohydrolase [Aquibacillus albus]MBM7573367.1 putative nucleotidyltransferase with HDIG domain [Aquibacillus albus]